MTSRTGFSVATLNLDHVVKLHHSEPFRTAYGQQTHVSADGRPIVWLSYCAGRNVELVTGSDLVEPMMRLCAEMSVPIALLGSTNAVLETVAKTVTKRYPGLTIATTIAPPMGFDPDAAQADTLLGDLARSGARVCFLALGAPKQEILAARGLKACPQMGFLSVGASLDFIAGTQTRAPRIVRAVGMEWAWRLLCNPRRLAARYGACLLILPRLLARALHTRRTNAHRDPVKHSGPS
ncbi:MAG: WecB/TagA/CpsF family glycosyltransferase [Tateyamaria sp.]